MDWLAQRRSNWGLNLLPSGQWSCKRRKRLSDVHDVWQDDGLDIGAPGDHLPVWSLPSPSACDMLLKLKKTFKLKSLKIEFDSYTLLRWLTCARLTLSWGPHKKKSITSKRSQTSLNNMAVRSETCSHWPPNIQKQNLTDARMDTAVVKQDTIMSGKQGLKHPSTPKNVQNVQWTSGLNDINNSRGVFTDSAISNIERFQERFTYKNTQEGRATYGLLAEQI